MTDFRRHRKWQSLICYMDARVFFLPALRSSIETSVLKILACLVLFYKSNLGVIFL